MTVELLFQTKTQLHTHIHTQKKSSCIKFSVLASSKPNAPELAYLNPTIMFQNLFLLVFSGHSVYLVVMLFCSWCAYWYDSHGFFFTNNALLNMFSTNQRCVSNRMEHQSVCMMETPHNRGKGWFVQSSFRAVHL